MIIKLPNADFSANNIGTVDLRTEISASTQAILDVYGKTWTLPQQFAIDDFLLGFNAASWKTKVKVLTIPIFGQPQSIAMNDVPVAFYDLISQTVRTPVYGSAFTGTMAIESNGFTDPVARTTNANNWFAFEFFEPTSWNDVHFGAYWNKTGTETNESIVASVNLIDATLKSDRAQIGSANKISFNFDPNSISTKGLRIISYDGTNKTGLAANLPFASATGSGSVDSSGFWSPNLLTRYDSITDVEIALITAGDSMTQPEIVEYNTLINTLMDALWTV
jgi:hypothetical protein